MLLRRIVEASVLTACLVLACGAPVAARGQADVLPATFQAGPPPVLPLIGVSGGEVSLELTIDATGHVGAIKPIRSTPGFAQPLTDAVRSWRFTPAEDRAPGPASGARRLPIASKVLVVAMLHPPLLVPPKSGETAKDLGMASADAPKVLSAVTPVPPPTATSGGIVLVEATVSPIGRAQTRVVISGSSGFDAACLAALRAWTFAPAQFGGRPVSSRMYVVFVFPATVP